MNARVFMVMVFSAVFMGIWNSDQQAMHKAIARNKKQLKQVATFPKEPVETVRAENLRPHEFSVPDPKPLRIAMRHNNETVSGSTVIEHHVGPIPKPKAPQTPVATPTPTDGDTPALETPAGESSESFSRTNAEPITIESAPVESVLTQQETHDAESVLYTEPVSQPISVENVVVDNPAENMATNVVAGEDISHDIAAAPVQAPEDFAVEVNVETSTAPAEHKTEPVTVEESVVAETVDAAANVESSAGSSIQPEEIVPADNRGTEKAIVMIADNVLVADNAKEESLVSHADEVPTPAEQTAPETSNAVLPEPAEPIVEESDNLGDTAALHGDTVALNESVNDPKEPATRETHEDEKSLEDKLLRSGEYDMLDVHSEDVTPGTVEPAQGGAACIPLPRNLASGTWQVIHPSGEFFKITVDRGRSSAKVAASADEELLETSFCITTSPDGVRWCFIRSFIDSPAPVRRVTTEFFSPEQH